MTLVAEIKLLVNPHEQTSIALLIERAASGDTAAFEQIMIHTQQRVMAMTWRILGNESDACDASQEVFLRVYKYLPRFKQDQDFFAWLYRITVNVCRDIAKKRQHLRTRFISLTPDPDAKAFDTAAPQADAEETAIYTQQRNLIARAMNTLPEKERASLVLRDVEGFSTDEVAVILNSSSTTVRSQISSARKKIRNYCESYLRRRERGSHEV